MDMTEVGQQDFPVGSIWRSNTREFPFLIVEKQSAGWNGSYEYMFRYVGADVPPSRAGLFWFIPRAHVEYVRVPEEEAGWLLLESNHS